MEKAPFEQNPDLGHIGDTPTETNTQGYTAIVAMIALAFGIAFVLKKWGHKIVG